MSVERRLRPIRSLGFGLLAIATTFVPSIAAAAGGSPQPDYNNAGVVIRGGATFPLRPGDIQGTENGTLYTDLSGNHSASSTPLPDYNNRGVKIRPGATFPLRPGDVSARRVRIGDRDTLVLYDDLSKNK